MAVDNYEVWRADWRKRFVSMDHGKLLKKLPFLKMDDEFVYVPYFGEIHRICRKTGAVEGKETPSLYDELNIFTLFWYCKETAALSDDRVSFHQLKDASPFDMAFRRGELAILAKTFTGHGAQLEKALLALGGKRLPVGDVGYEIEPFPCIPMGVVFWEGDEDFPAQANLLFDRSATDFIHVESIVTIASEGIRHLAKLADVPLQHGGI